MSNIKPARTKEEFIHEFAKFSRVQINDSRYFWDAFESYLEESIENQIPFRLNGIMELYFSTMKERSNVRVGTGSKEKVILPVTRKARLRLANKHRKAQNIQNKVMRPILEEMEKEEEEDEI